MPDGQQPIPPISWTGFSMDASLPQIHSSHLQQLPETESIHKEEFSTGMLVNDLKTDVDFLLREASLGVETRHALSNAGVAQW